MKQKPHSPVKQTGDLDFYRIRSNDGYIRYEIYVQNPDFAEYFVGLDEANYHLSLINRNNTNHWIEQV